MRGGMRPPNNARNIVHVIVERWTDGLLGDDSSHRWNKVEMRLQNVAEGRRMIGAKDVVKVRAVIDPAGIYSPSNRWRAVDHDLAVVNIQWWPRNDDKMRFSRRDIGWKRRLVHNLWPRHSCAYTHMVVRTAMRYWCGVEIVWSSNCVTTAITVRTPAH